MIFNNTLDRVAIALILILTLAIGLLVGAGNALQIRPHVRNFTWEGERIGAEDKAFLLTFNRPVDRQSVEENLKIDPPLPGKFSWAGRKMAYTLYSPAPYGEAYQVELDGARVRFQDEVGEEIKPFEALFSTRDRAFVYIGVEGREKGRLILYNLTKQKQEILTPPDLVVTQLHPYADGSRVLFAAMDKRSWRKGLQEEKLYTIPTGLNPDTNSQGLELVLDNSDYRNTNFDLSEDGETIVVQRINRKNPADFGLWVVKPKEKPYPLNNPPGGEFLIAPDSQTLAITQGEGVAITPLDEEGEALDFLPSFGEILSFSKDGTAAAMVNFNTQSSELRYTRSLYLVTNQNVQKKLLDTSGSILDCQFNPSGTSLYCLLTELGQGEEYVEKPFLAAINLETAEVMPLVMFPEQIDIKMTMAPDGIALLFDGIITDPNLTDADAVRSNSGEAIATSRLWLLPISPLDLPDPEETELVELPLPGFRPSWIP